MRHGRSLSQWLVLALSVYGVASQHQSAGEAASPESRGTDSSGSEETTTRKATRTYDFDIDNTDWGTYHDPQG